MSKNSSAKYYQNNKRKATKKRSRKMPKKEKKRQYGCERYKNLQKDEKQKLVQNRKIHYKMRNNALL